MSARSEEGKSGVDPAAATEIADSATPASDPGATRTESPGARDRARRAAATDSLVGQELAHFRVEALLGKGGMGEVYRATDLALDRPVALKVLAPEIAADSHLRERFLREARSQARIQHPNVCHIYFIGEERGRLFFAMEYIDGESLQERLDREGKLPPGEAIEYCRMAAEGLREAHRHGFTHRDIKPSNLMVDRHGHVKVVDFGIVKQTRKDEEAAETAGLTVEGVTLLGTPLYMAPEQARGERIDFRADLYALGATLHHLVSGEPPFQGPSTMAIVSKHLSDPRPRLAVRVRRGDAGGGLDALCDRMMAKRPDARFASYDDLLASLERLSPEVTRPAGFFVRTFAAGLDLLVITLLTLPVSLLLPNDSTGQVVDNLLFFALAPLYSIFLHGRFGRTAGKALLEIEVVASDADGPPGTRRAALRFLLQAGLTYVGLGIAVALSVAGGEIPQAISVVIALGAIFAPVVHLVWVALSPAKRARWDRWAGTLVRYRPGRRPGRSKKA